ncbi:MAG: DUF4337 domain-containing protein [Polyangiales bacterium]
MEEELETGELKETLDEHVEHAAHAEHGGGHGEAKATPSWIKYLSLTTAMVAVLAAVASLLSGSNSNEAILEKSNAMLNQSLASDQWAFYQAKSLKGSLAQSEAEIVMDSKPAVAAKFLEDSKRYKAEGEEIQKKAEHYEEQVKENNEECDHLMHKHHKFAITVTLLQISIALSAIAALTRRRELWFVGLATTGAGVVTFVLGLMS